MKNGQEYCSVLRVQFSMNQKQLSWLLLHILLSARKWEFFSYFFAGKVLAERNQMRYFFPSQMLKCWTFRFGPLETEESLILETAGGVLQPQTLSGPLTELNHDCL